MSEHENETKEALETLSLIRRYWKHVLGTLGVSLVFLPMIYYAFDMVAYPWAHGLTGQSPEGSWIGEISLDSSSQYIVQIELDHDTDFSGNRKNYVAEISGLISICSRGAAPLQETISGDPSWTGSSVKLFSKINFTNEIRPEEIACLTTADAMQCIFDFERPISNASRKFRKEFKNVYTPKAEFNAKIPVQFSRFKTGDVPFQTQCNGNS
jgi:hypothetical protein